MIQIGKKYGSYYKRKGENKYMKYTSSEANKLLKKLYEEEHSILMLEERSKEFRASIGEELEAIRPAYDYQVIQKELDRINNQIVKVKHAINLFNVQTKIPGFDLTIDQALIFMAQLTNRIEKLSLMKNRLPMERVGATGMSGRSGLPIIEYDYANYDIQQVTADYVEKADQLAKLQTALDLLNNTETFDIEL